MVKQLVTTTIAAANTTADDNNEQNGGEIQKSVSHEDEHCIINKIPEKIESDEMPMRSVAGAKGHLRSNAVHYQDPHVLEVLMCFFL